MFVNTSPCRSGFIGHHYAGNDPLNFRDPTGLRQAGNPLNNLLSNSFNQSTHGTNQSKFPADALLPRSVSSIVDALPGAVNLNLIDSASLTAPQTSALSTSFSTSLGRQPAVATNSFQIRNVDEFPSESRSVFTDDGGRTRSRR